MQRSSLKLLNKREGSEATHGITAFMSLIVAIQALYLIRIRWWPFHTWYLGEAYPAAHLTVGSRGTNVDSQLVRRRVYYVRICKDRDSG